MPKTASPVDYSDVEDEYEDVQGGDFMQTIVFATPAQVAAGEPGQVVFLGSYIGPVSKMVKGKSRTFQHFLNEDGEEVEAWGTAILDSKLKAVAADHKLPVRVRIKYLGKTASTSNGPAHDFQVGVSKAAIGTSRGTGTDTTGTE